MLNQFDFMWVSYVDRALLFGYGYLYALAHKIKHGKLMMEINISNKNRGKWNCILFISWPFLTCESFIRDVLAAVSSEKITF